MPELPEVETIRQQMEKELVDDTIVHVHMADRAVFFGDATQLIGQKINRLHRVGKYLFLYFESGRGISIHLKMTGRILLDQKQSEHTRIAVQLTSGRTLSYWDTRKFGYWKVIDNISALESQIKTSLGPEPWNIDDISFLRKLQKTRRSIKDTLLDQTILSGIGNIYANDGLWLAGVDPRRRANTLTLTEARVLLESLRTVLERGLATGGASDNSYRDLYGGRGGYQNEFLVYGKTKKPCHRCGMTLTYTRIGGRGTWYCERCQR